MSIRRYFKSTVNLPTPSQAQLSPNVLREVNQAVTAALEREEAGNQAKQGKKRKYNASFTPEDRAAIGRYAAKNGNAAAVKKFKTTHGVGESTVRLFKKRYQDEIKKLENTGASEVNLKLGRSWCWGSN